MDPEQIRSAMDMLQTRGPDDAGEWIHENIGFGHRRLSVLDPSPCGHQPMFSEDGRYVIVLNGEIYNFREIREVIDRNHCRWKSSSDTEVVLAAYEKWGIRCLEHFRGMFAFAIWDKQNRVLFAARDRLGVKPFFYHFSDDCFAFASRPRALLALNQNWSSPLDNQAVRFYLETGFIPAPYSVFKQIRKLPPSHFLLLNDSGLRVERYWDFRSLEPAYEWSNRPEQDLLDELDEIVTRSVRYRMISDVPLGTFLSGGIDSSLVTSLMAKQSPKVKTFTIGFTDARFDESERALAVSRHLGTEHHSETLDPTDLLHLMPTFCSEFDEPLYDSSAFPTMAVSRLARRHVTVSLSGDGGDELFGGYPYYQIVRRLEPFYRLPAKVRQLLSSCVAAVPRHRMKLLAGALRKNNAAEAFSYCRTINKDLDSLFVPDLVRGTIGIHEFFAREAEQFPSNLSSAERAMRLDALYTLPDDYLQKVDVASMAFSLESREPLLDHELVEWAMKLPQIWKLKDGDNKYLLRRLAYRYVPKHLLDYPKRGFEVPIREWMRGPLRGWSEQQLANKELFGRVYLDREHVLATYSLHATGRRDVHYAVWSAVVLLEFARRLASLPAPACPAVMGL